MVTLGTYLRYLSNSVESNDQEYYVTLGDMFAQANKFTP